MGGVGSARRRSGPLLATAKGYLSRLTRTDPHAPPLQRAQTLLDELLTNSAFFPTNCCPERRSGAWPCPGEP